MTKKVPAKPHNAESVSPRRTGVDIISYHAVALCMYPNYIWIHLLVYGDAIPYILWGNRFSIVRLCGHILGQPSGLFGLLTPRGNADYNLTLISLRANPVYRRINTDQVYLNQKS